MENNVAVTLHILYEFVKRFMRIPGHGLLMTKMDMTDNVLMCECVTLAFES